MGNIFVQNRAEYKKAAILTVTLKTLPCQPVKHAFCHCRACVCVWVYVSACVDFSPCHQYNIGLEYSSLIALEWTILLLLLQWFGSPEGISGHSFARIFHTMVKRTLSTVNIIEIVCHLWRKYLKNVRIYLILSLPISCSFSLSSFLFFLFFGDSVNKCAFLWNECGRHDDKNSLENLPQQRGRKK